MPPTLERCMEKVKDLAKDEAACLKLAGLILEQEFTLAVERANMKTVAAEAEAAAAVKRQHKRLRSLTLPPKLY